MENIVANDSQAAGVSALRNAPQDAVLATGRWNVECRDREGNLVWTRTIKNLVTTEGLTELLDKLFAGSAYTSPTWYAGLVDNAGFTQYAAGDTLASHAGWTEFTGYTGDRKAVTWGAAAAGAIASSSIGTFTANASGTIRGLIICNAETGTAGELFSEGDFDEGNAPVATGYVITTSYSVSLANAA